MCVMIFFFFSSRRRHTRCSRDWSSDVCSSDLGRADLAAAARDRWLALNRRTYRSTGRMMEKYDVVDPHRRAGGGEDATQDGFGWTNGVAPALAAQGRGRHRIGTLPHTTPLRPPPRAVATAPRVEN